MLRGPLHNRGADGLCEECREPFPCPTGLAIFEAVVKAPCEHKRREYWWNGWHWCNDCSKMVRPEGPLKQR